MHTSREILDQIPGREALATSRELIAAQVVTVFPDRMERYFTTELFAPFR